MVSILLAVYNGEKYINQCVDSIINQTFKDWELLVGFNGTTDRSKDIVSSYSDNRIKIFDYGEDKGKSKTLNKLIKESKYDFCAIQDDDDIWMPMKLEKQIGYVKKYDIIGTFVDYIDENNQIIGCPNLFSDPEQIKFLMNSGVNQIANCSSLFKKSIVNKIKGWNEDLDSLPEKGLQPKEDFDLWIRLLREGFVFYNIDEKLVMHRLHPDSKFNNLNIS